MVAYATSHNGGRTQTNVNLTSGDRSYPLLNHLKNGSHWIFITGGALVPPANLDSNGYMNVFASGGCRTTFVVPTSAKRSGNYVVGWSGGGTLRANGTSSSAGRFTFAAPSDGVVTLDIIAINSTSDYPGNGGGPNAIYICHENDETALLAGEVFGVKFMEKMREANFGVIRMMNMQGSPFTGANGSQITNWASRRAENYVFYSTYEFRTDWYAGTTTNTGNAYSIAAPPGWQGTVGGKPTDKQTIQVIFNASASAAPASLTVTGGSGGDTDAINILNASSGALGVNQYPVANFAATMVYDATLDGWIKQGGSTQSQGCYNGWPPEILLRLCGELGAHPHWITPHMAASVQPTDYSIELALLNKTFRDSNCPWMKPRVEGQNETWNPNGAFTQTGYATVLGAALWAGGGFHDWYGMHMSFVGQMWAEVFGAVNLGTGYAVLCGVQTAAGSVPTSITGNGNNERLTASKFVAQVAAAPSLTWSGGTLNFTKTAPAPNLVSHLTVANYFAPGLYATTTGTVSEASLSTAYNGGAGDKTAPTTYADSLNPDYIASASLFVSGTPGKVNWPGHGLSVDDRVHFVSEGTMASGVSSAGTGTIYFVKTVEDVDNFTISTTSGGTAANFSGTPSGTSYCIAAFSRFSPITNVVYHKNWKAWAASLGVNKMCGYEGGFSPDYTSGGSSDLDKLKAAAKLVTTMPSDVLGLLGVRYKAYVAFDGLSDETFTAEYPSDFLPFGPSPSTNAWAILEDLYQAPNPPQWEALRLYNARLRRHGLIAST